MTIETGRFDGALLIVRLNWPFYALAAAVAAGWPLLSPLAPAGATKLLGWLVWIATVWWTAASIAASHWVYDRSRLRSTEWVRDLLLGTPSRWLNIHAGFDQNTAALRALFPNTSGASLDVFDGARMTEPAIRRARRRDPGGAIPTRHSALPVADASVDAAFLIFAAHELRTPSSREELFAEIARVLTDDGRLVIAEHTRDPMNVAAYGPGAWHFLPRAEWPRLARSSGLAVAVERSITPFVHIWAFSRRPLPDLPKSPVMYHRRPGNL